jgi:cysteine-rich repeat protein
MVEYGDSMRKNRIVQALLVAGCTTAIIVLVMFQARIALRPRLHIALGPPPIAYGYAWRNIRIAGVVFTNEGITTMGAGRTVAVTFNGGTIRGTGATTATGSYVISNLSHSGAGVVVTAFLQDAVEDAVTVTTLSGGDLHGLNLYQNRLIVRTDSGSSANLKPLTNVHLDTGDNNGDSDILAIYRSNGTTVHTQSGKGLVVWAGDIYTPGGNVQVGSGITIRGTLRPETHTITLSGSWITKPSGTFTPASSRVHMNGTHQTLSGSTSFAHLTKTGASAYTMSVEAGSTQTFSGTLSLRGTNALSRLSLRSTTAGTQWNLNPQSTRSIAFLDVRDSRNTHATPINCYVTGCADSANNVGWDFRQFSVRGTAYSDEGSTAIGTNRIVAVSANGGPKLATGATTSTGFYLLEHMQFTGGLVLAAFLDNGAEDAVTATILSSTGLTGFDLYKDRLIVRSDSGSYPITNTHLATADNIADSDLLSVFHVDSSSALGTGSGTEVFVWTGDTFQPGGRVKTHDLDVRGTLTLGTNGLTASGSVAVTGSLTTSTGILLTSIHRETLALTGVTLQNLTIDNGLWGYWKLDDGTGSTVRDSSQLRNNGTTSGIDVGTHDAGWVRGTSGTTLFYNPKSLLFDGNSDFVNIGDVLNVPDKQDFTITAWFDRYSFDGKHTFLAKKSGSGASAAGYMLWMDDATDTVQFGVSDGSNTYHLASTTAVTTPRWHHVAVVWDQDSAANTEIYIDGVDDNATDTGTIGNVGDLGNTQSLRIGAESDGERSFHGKLDDIRIYRRALGSSEILALAQGKKETGSGVYSLASNMDINGNLGMFAGTLAIASGASKTITVAGNIENHAGFERGSGTVTLDGTNQTVSGSTIFNVLRKVATTALTLTLDFTARQSASGSLVLTGADASTRMSIRSTKSGSTARLVLDTAGNQTLRYLDVRDNRASSGAMLACSTECYDSGNNFNWGFACGDGVISGTETCDDGNTTSGDGCSSSCATESGYTCTGQPSTCSTSCGDGVVAGSEQCDEGGSNSNAPNATCRTDCTNQRCGDAIKDTGEACDDGNTSDSDACLSTCVAASCGDGFIREGVEQCEPPGTANCLENCQVRTTGGGGGGGSPVSSSSKSYYRRPDPPLGCGNAVLEPEKGEQCDKGRFNELGDCSYNCKILYCGDGEITLALGEECEPVPTAGPNGERLYEVATCGQVCTAPDENGSGGCQVNFLSSCDAPASSAPSDGIHLAPPAFTPEGAIPEMDAGTPFDEEGQGEASACGDTYRTDPEQCDDGNLQDNDGCSGTCILERAIAQICGDGIAVGSEDCDDGNNVSGDGCSLFCQREETLSRCGDGQLDAGEQCDGGPENSDTVPNACRRSCRPAQCGDFVVDAGEQCDEGSANTWLAKDRCRPDCQRPRCGDGVKDTGEECDGGLSCTASCRNAFALPPRCGDGRREGSEECDDGNTADGDGCTRTCVKETPPAAPVLIARVRTIDADIVIVNPTEIAVALAFLPSPDPCARVTAEGSDLDAREIREAAERQRIPIVRDPPLARALFEMAEIGGVVVHPLCERVNALRGGSSSSSPSARPSAPSLLSPFPQYVPIASVIPLSHTPVGDTGPGAALLITAGVAAGWNFFRKKKVR